MAVTEETIRIWLKSAGAKDVRKDLESVGGSITRLEGNVKTVAKFNKETGKWAKSMGVVSSATKGFNMNLLSTMFMGMQLQRTFGNLFKGMVDNFKKISAKSSPLNLALTRLTFGFDMLRFSIIQAMGPHLTKLVNWIANLAIAFSEMNPKTLEAIGWAIVGLFSLGGLMFAASQFKLFIDAATNLIKAAPLLQNIKWGFAKLPGGVTLTSLLGIGAILAAPLVIAWIFNKEGTREAFENIKRHVANQEYAKIPIEVLFWTSQTINNLAEFGAHVLISMFKLGNDILDFFKELFRNIFTLQFGEALDMIKRKTEASRRQFAESQARVYQHLSEASGGLIPENFLGIQDAAIQMSTAAIPAIDETTKSVNLFGQQALLVTDQWNALASAPSQITKRVTFVIDQQGGTVLESGEDLPAGSLSARSARGGGASSLAGSVKPSGRYG